MNRQESYEWVLVSYPSVISKEQLYQICHVSKRTALAYLKFGMIPSKCTGKKTRKYSIKLVDVIVFLKARDNAPSDYSAPQGWYKGKPKISILHPTPEVSLHMHNRFISTLEPYPDLLSPRQVQDITGYALSSVTKWCHTGRLYHYRIQGGNRVPKLALLDFLTGDYFQSIRIKSRKHLLMINQACKSVMATESTMNKGGKGNG